MAFSTVALLVGMLLPFYCCLFRRIFVFVSFFFFLLSSIKSIRAPIAGRRAEMKRGREAVGEVKCEHWLVCQHRPSPALNARGRSAMAAVWLDLASGHNQPAQFDRLGN